MGVCHWSMFPFDRSRVRLRLAVRGPGHANEHGRPIASSKVHGRKARGSSPRVVNVETTTTGDRNVRVCTDCAGVCPRYHGPALRRWQDTPDPWLLRPGDFGSDGHDL